MRLSGSRPRWARGKSSFRRRAIRRRSQWAADGANAVECRPSLPSFDAPSHAYSPNRRFQAAISMCTGNSVPTRISDDSRNSRATDDPH